MQRNRRNQQNKKDQTAVQKIRNTKGIFHAKIGTIKERNGIDLTEAENIKKKSDKNIQKNCTNKGLTGPDNQNGVPTHIVKHSGA